MKRLFSRRILLLLATALGVALTLSLGQWQLRRAAQKEALVQERSAQAARPVLDAGTLGGALDSPLNRQGLLYRRVKLPGQWLPEHTVYLDNRQMRGQPGFFVLTPFRLTATQAVILVQRGWVPRDFHDRSALPHLTTPDGPVLVQGQLTPWPSRIHDFGAVETGAIRQNLDFDAYTRQTRLPLLELSVQQTGPTEDGLLRDWPVVASGVEKHHGYAAQWFGLSALIALLYVWFQIVQPRRKTRTG